ncbi:MAG: hypothetical protein D4R90_03900 [Nitrosopumilales archaeon]|nr:MAG: hypothetical protein D4R90_03900 [Nitrosopumilales archaeon]
MAVVMITGFLFSTGSSWGVQPILATPFDNVSHGYLGTYTHDTTTIAEKQQMAEQKALAKYMSYYQFANLDQSKRNWSGLTSTATDETSRGRNIDAQAQVSMQNAVAQFDVIHVRQLANLRADDYKGISSTPTDEQGRIRTDMIASATASSMVSADDIMNQLVKIQEKYSNFAPSTPTDTVATYDRQTMITQNQATAESEAASLVSELAKRYGVFLDLTPYVGTNIPYVYKPGSITNEMTHGGRNLTPLQAQSLEKAIFIFNEIHNLNIRSLASSYYGLTSTPTDTNGRDRNAMLAEAQERSTANALRVYNSYYGNSLR